LNYQERDVIKQEESSGMMISYDTILE